MAVTPFDPTYPKTPCCMQSQLCFRTGVIVDGSFTLQEWQFSTFFGGPCDPDLILDPMTFIYELLP